MKPRALKIVITLLLACVAPGGVDRLHANPPAADLEKAKVVRAHQVMKGLEVAIKGYKIEYLRLPTAQKTVPANDSESSTAVGTGKELMQVLLATSRERNPRAIRFWEAPDAKPDGSGYTEDSGLRDPWGKLGYQIILDYDGDGKIADPEGKGDGIEKDVLIYSAGPDGDFTTWADNVCSWK